MVVLSHRTKQRLSGVRTPSPSRKTSSFPLLRRPTVVEALSPIARPSLSRQSFIVPLRGAQGLAESVAGIGGHSTDREKVDAQIFRERYGLFARADILRAVQFRRVNSSVCFRTSAFSSMTMKRPALKSAWEIRLAIRIRFDDRAKLCPLSEKRRRGPLPSSFAPTRNFPYYQKLGSENHTENKGVMDESLRSHLGNLCKWISNGLMENKEGIDAPHRVNFSFHETNWTLTR